MLFVAAAVITATLLPWGGLAQTVSVVIGCLTLLASVWYADANFVTLTSDPALAVGVAFVASVIVASEMQRARVESRRQRDLRRTAEAETLALNAALEDRVRERTAALEDANRRLEGEIAERGRVSEALLESRQRLLDIVDNTTALVSLKDRDGRYILVNRAFEDFVGSSREELLGTVDEDLLSRERAARQRAHDQRVLAREAAHSFEEEIDGPGDGYCHFSVKFPLRRPGGGVYGVGTVSTDITRLRRAEQQARQRQDDLAHVQRLHLVNQMAASLAHELHQPLCAIANYAQGGTKRLSAGEINGEELAPILERISSEALRAGEVLRGVRRMVDRQSSPAEPVDVDTAIEEAVDSLQFQARRHRVDIEVVRSSLPAVALADKTQLEQVVVNLALNGIDSIAGGDPYRRRISIASRVLSDEVEIIVSDSGPGIAPTAAAKLFTPFFTTKSSGLGMGLAISRAIVEAHGGELRLVPSLAGASFRFTLPRAESP
jgi:PAS domain S-box-containing protein